MDLVEKSIDRHKSEERKKSWKRSHGGVHLRRVVPVVGGVSVNGGGFGGRLKVHGELLN